MRPDESRIDTAAISRDAYLGGRITLAQPRRGYRAGIDPVLLAASVPAAPGQTVLDLGCGVGAALFCLAARVPGLELTGVERQHDYAVLARQNAQANGVEARIVEADLADLPGDLRQERFDHILANPPFFCPAAGSASEDAGRAASRAEQTPLASWITVAARRLAPAGMLHMVHRAERLPDILALLHGRLGAIEVKPLAPRAGRDARLVLVRARKGGRAAFRLHAPLILHEGPRHLADAEDYTATVRGILREAHMLQFTAAA